MRGLTTMVLSMLVLLAVMAFPAEVSGQYVITTPPHYTVFSGDLDFNYSIPGHVGLPHAFIRLEFLSKGKTEHMIITTMGLRLGFSSGSLKVACGVIEFAGNYTLRMYTRVNGEILTETILDVRWPEVVLSLPDNHEAQTSSVELRIISNANCPSRLQRHFLQIKLFFQRTNLQDRKMSMSETSEIFAANFTSIDVPYTTLTLGCHLFDLDGFYQAVLVSSARYSSMISASNVMTVSWNVGGYHITIMNNSAFPCQGSIFITYGHPACSGLDKLRLYSFTPTTDGSPASPLERSYITEVVADPGKTLMSFDCKLFNQSSSGFCFVYVSITRGDVVSEQTQACIPAQANSVFPIDGGWSKWTSWTSCSVTCGSGKRSRFRMCNEPAPKYGGRFCAGDPMQWTPCELHCPEAIPRTPLHSPTIDPSCACGCTKNEAKGQIIATGRCHGLSSWLIQTTDGHYVALRFDYFSLNYTRQWVKVRDGATITDVLLFSSSSSGYPMEIVSSGAAMRVELMTTYTSPPPVAIFPKNATLPIHAHGFIASYDIRALVASSIAPSLFQYEKEAVMSSTITIVGIVICVVVIIVAIVFVLIQRTLLRRRVKYTMTSSGDSPVNQSQAASSSSEHPASNAHSGSPSGHSNIINVDMEVPLTGKTQRKFSGSKTSRTPSLSSTGSHKMKNTKSKGDNPAKAKNSSSNKKAAKSGAKEHSPCVIEIIDTDELVQVDNTSTGRPKTPKTPDIKGIHLKNSPSASASPTTKLRMLNKKQHDKKPKAVATIAERDITGSSGSMSPSTTKAEVNWPQSSMVRTALQEVSNSLSDKQKRSGQRPPSEEIPLLDSMTSSQESPSHFNFNNMVKSDSSDSSNQPFVRPVPNKARRPTSLTESYDESIPNSKPKIDHQISKPKTDITDIQLPRPKPMSQAARKAMFLTQSKPSTQEPAIIPVNPVQLPPPAPSSVNTKQPLTSSNSKNPLKQSSSQASIASNISANSRLKKSALEERQTILPKPDGQSPKPQRRENSSLGVANKDLINSPGKTSRTSSKNTLSSPARSMTTPSEIEGLELEYDDFIEDDPLSYFDYEETQKLAFRGVERLGKMPIEDEDEEEEAQV